MKLEDVIQPDQNIRAKAKEIASSDDHMEVARELFEATYEGLDTIEEDKIYSLSSQVIKEVALKKVQSEGLKRVIEVMTDFYSLAYEARSVFNEDEEFQFPEPKSGFAVYLKSKGIEIALDETVTEYFLPQDQNEDLKSKIADLAFGKDSKYKSAFVADLGNFESNIAGDVERDLTTSNKEIVLVKYGVSSYEEVQQAREEIKQAKKQVETIFQELDPYIRDIHDYGRTGDLRVKIYATHSDKEKLKDTYHTFGTSQAILMGDLSLTRGEIIDSLERFEIIYSQISSYFTNELRRMERNKVK